MTRQFIKQEPIELNFDTLRNKLQVNLEEPTESNFDRVRNKLQINLIPSDIAFCQLYNFQEQSSSQCLYKFSKV